MARADLLNTLYSKEKSPLEFQFDSMWFIPMANILPFYEIEKLYNIATSIKLASKAEMKLKTIRQIMESHDFKFFHGGTNRTIYRHLECTDIVAKIAIDRVGMQDNPLEFNNQQYLKPFVTKTFEVSPCGTVGIAERVEPITSKAEFISIGESIFELLTNNIIGEYVLQDIGTKFFRNWGLRKGFGPVLLDYPYMFKLDGNKLFCNKEIDLNTGELCGGLIDYDAGFNNLVCKTCGKTYQARDLQQYISRNEINFKDEELDNMIVEIKRGNKTVYSIGEINDTSVPRRNKRNINHSKKYNEETLQTQIVGGKFCSNNIVNVQNEQDIRNTEMLKNASSVAEEEKRVLLESTQVKIDTGMENPDLLKDREDNLLPSKEELPYMDSVPLSKYPIQKDVDDSGVQNQPKFNTQSVFMSPAPAKEESKDGQIELTAEEIQAKMMANALGCEDELNINTSSNHEVKEDVVKDDYVDKKYGDLHDEDQENFEKFNHKNKIDISTF